MGKSPTRQDLLQGTLDLLVLKTLSLGPQHGWGISQRIQQRSREVLEVNQGSLYPALHRLEEQDFLVSEWRESENGRRARYYRLSALGKKQLETETRSWLAFSAAVQWILEAA
jgi:PadR family transcriptional regulator, regulatory protein PadR